MAVTGYELYRVMEDYVTADLICWRRYRRRCFGIVEKMLDANPQLSFIHRTTPFIPPGVYVRVPIDPDLVLARPPATPTQFLWTDRQGYRLP